MCGIGSSQESRENAADGLGFELLSPQAVGKRGSCLAQEAGLSEGWWDPPGTHQPWPEEAAPPSDACCLQQLCCLPCGFGSDLGSSVTSSEVTESMLSLQWCWEKIHGHQTPAGVFPAVLLELDGGGVGVSLSTGH